MEELTPSFEEVVRNLHFLPCIAEALLNAFSRKEKKMQEIAETAYSGTDYAFPLLKRSPFTRLLVVCLLLKNQFIEYQKVGASEETIWDTFQDVSVRSNLTYLATGKIGVSKEEVIWFSHIFSTAIFKIGVLQYEITKLQYPKKGKDDPYMELSKEGKELLAEGCDVLSCHIRHGVDLKDSSVEASLRKAETFFKKHYAHTKFRAFVCSSWLLYPPMQELLGEQSKIRQFASHFTIIATCPDRRQAMERIFSYGSRNLPKEKWTSLQVLTVQNKKRLGYAIGVIMMKMETDIL
jgi:hypothetical protein